MIIGKDHTEFFGQVIEFSIDYISEIKSIEYRPNKSDEYGSRFYDETKKSITKTNTIPKKQYVVVINLLALLQNEEKPFSSIRYVDTDLDKFELAEENILTEYFNHVYSEKKPLLKVGVLMPHFGSPSFFDIPPIQFDPTGLKRNLGVFGQSGSGKSYALGKILEELHLQTDIDIIVLDLNGDFVKFKDPFETLETLNRNTYYKTKIEDYQKNKDLHQVKDSRVRVLSNDDSLTNVNPYAIKLRDLSDEELCVLFNIDPILEKDLYWNVLVELKRLTEIKGVFTLNDIERHFSQGTPVKSDVDRLGIFNPFLKQILPRLDFFRDRMINSSRQKEETRKEGL